MYMTQQKAGQWETVKKEAKKKREGDGSKPQERDRLGRLIDPSAAALSAFDRGVAADKAAAAAAKAAAAKASSTYQGGFAGLEVEAPPAALQDPADQPSASANGGRAGGSSNKPAKQQQPKQPKQPKKPKLSVAQVSAELDVGALQGWMAEAQQRYASNETAQLQALSDQLLVSFREATFDLSKAVNSKGLRAASELPLAELPHTLSNALGSFVASLSEPALVQVLGPLVTAVVTEAAAAAGGGGVPPGKGKAGLCLALAVILRTRPQALVQAAGDLRLAGRQLTGPGRLPLLLWVINQAALADPAVGVAVWVRLLLPQLLGVLELPAAAGAGGKPAPKAAAGSGDPAQLLVPLDAASQAAAREYLAGLLAELGVGAAGGGAATAGGDVTRGDGNVEPTVPGAAVEMLSRLIAGKPWGGSSAAAAPAGSNAGEGKKAAAARAAAVDGLAPLLPGITALAAVSGCSSHYAEWLLLALESAALSDAPPEAPPEALVLRSASNVVACLCGNEGCFALWESKHKGSLRGSARVLAALVAQPQLLGPLLQQRSSKESLRRLLAALPARHRTFLAAGKGWQGACARVAEDACAKLPRRLGGWGSWGSSGRGGSGGGGSSRASPLMAALAVGSLAAGVLGVAGRYRNEVAGVVAAYAGKDAAQQLDAHVLAPLQAAVGAALSAAEPQLQQLQAATAPALAAASEALAPVWARVQQQLQPALLEGQQLAASLLDQLQEIVARAKQP